MLSIILNPILEDCLTIHRGHGTEAVFGAIRLFPEGDGYDNNNNNNNSKALNRSVSSLPEAQSAVNVQLERSK